MLVLQLVLLQIGYNKNDCVCKLQQAILIIQTYLMKQVSYLLVLLVVASSLRLQHSSKPSFSHQQLLHQQIRPRYIPTNRGFVRPNFNIHPNFNNRPSFVLHPNFVPHPNPILHPNFVSQPIFVPQPHLVPQTNPIPLTNFLPNQNQQPRVNSLNLSSMSIAQAKAALLASLPPGPTVILQNAFQLRDFFNSPMGKTVLLYVHHRTRQNNGTKGLNRYNLSDPNFRLWMAIKMISDKDIGMYKRSVTLDDNLFSELIKNGFPR